VERARGLDIADATASDFDGAIDVGDDLARAESDVGADTCKEVEKVKGAHRARYFDGDEKSRHVGASRDSAFIGHRGITDANVFSLADFRQHLRTLDLHLGVLDTRVEVDAIPAQEPTTKTDTVNE